MAGLFSTAKTIATKPTAKAKKEKRSIELPGLSDVAKLDALIKAATAMKATLENEIKVVGFAEFMKNADGKRPENFEGVDGEAKASVELRKRGTNSPLNEDEVAALATVGITPFEQVVTPELFAINPKYIEDAALITKVEKALAKIVPEDFIVRQEPVVKKVVSDEMLEEAFKSHKTPAIMELLTTMALKPKMTPEYDQRQLMADVTEIMFPSPKPRAVKKTA